jgi:hypothetical protein
MLIRTLAAALGVTAAVLVAPTPAMAAPSCVSRINAEERSTYGTAWGHDIVAWLASDPAPLQELGYANIGALARALATSPHDACPAE